MLLGDTSQHESVGRGSVLRGLADQHGALDLRTTRRANEAWLRGVATDLRAGVVSRALDVLRDKGAVREFLRSRRRARGARAVVAQATRAGKSALLVASRNDDVRAMNELAREAVRERIGQERVYATDFGERTFGIGDVLVGRERAHGGVNGDLYTLAGHRDDGRLEERLGGYELAPVVAARDAREADRRAVGITERVERLRAQPELVLDRLAETRSVWNEADIEREVRSALGVRSGHDAQIASATRAVVRACVAGDRHGCVHYPAGGERRARGVRGGGDASRSRAGHRAAGAGCRARCAATPGVYAAGRQAGPRDRDGHCRRWEVAVAA
jgi:hypothetical protein